MKTSSLFFLVIGLVLSASSAALAGGGGPDEYLCSSPTQHVSVTLFSQLGSDLYKKGLTLEVGLGNQESIYEIVSYFDNGNLIEFTMKPTAGEPNFGLFIFSDVVQPQSKTVIQVKTPNGTLTASDVKCQLL